MRLRIWHKMIIGISIPSLIALAGIFFSYYYLKDIENRQSYVEIADDLKENVLELRRGEKTFLHFKNRESVDKIYEGITKLKKSIEKISPESAEELGRGDFSNLLDLIETYPRLITVLFENYQRETTVIDRVRIEGRKLEELSGKGKLASVLSNNFILNLRRLEKNFMLFRDAKSYNEMDEGLSQLKTAIPVCVLCKPYIGALNSLSSIYGDSDHIFAKLQETGSQLEKTTEKIALRERKRIAVFLSHIKKLLIIALVLVSFIGPLFIYTTASYIVAPVKRLSGIIKKISEGDINLRAPIKEHDETYDLANSFNKMLDNLLSTRVTLEKTVEILHEKQKEIEKRASLGFLISGVTHELNNPLNNISLTAETIKEEVNDLSKDELNEMVQDILTQSERAKHIMEDLLDFAGARKSREMGKMDVINAIEEAVNLTANELRINNITLEMDVSDKARFINGIKTKLEEVFVNMIINAIHAIDGSGTLTIRSWSDRHNFYVQFRDTGHGISKENIKNIFEPFFTTKEVGEGTGLGLSVSQGIINDHNGDIQVESIPGKETTFTIRLPLYTERAG